MIGSVQNMVGTLHWGEFKEESTAAIIFRELTVQKMTQSTHQQWGTKSPEASPLSQEYSGRR